MQANARLEYDDRGGSQGLDLTEIVQESAKSFLAQCIVPTISAQGARHFKSTVSFNAGKPKILRFLRGPLDDFSTSRSLRFLMLLGQDIHIVVRAPTGKSGPSTHRPRGIAKGVHRP